MPSVADWLAVLDEWYPPSSAEEWDNVGLQVGGRSWPADRVLVALDATAEVIAESASKGCGLLVTHHPLLFRPLSRVDVTDAAGRAVAAALSAPLAVFACHTNADAADPGVSDALADALGFEVTGPLGRAGGGDDVKLVTFVPADATAKVLDAVAAAGAGEIGEYSHCSFRVRGTGTFFPSAEANPVVGARGELNEVDEDRLEVVVRREGLAAAVEALVDAHPYEEVAYDVYPLVGVAGGSGIGRVARAPEPLPLVELARRCRDRLRSTPRFAGDPDQEVATVAVCGGSGAPYVAAARRAGADAYVTGDVKHHDALDAAAAGLGVVDAGHHATEWPFVRHLADRLGATGLGEVLVSETPTDPFATP